MSAISGVSSVSSIHSGMSLQDQATVKGLEMLNSDEDQVDSTISAGARNPDSVNADPGSGSTVDDGVWT